ncbi:uncharacterized protein DFE_2671 [Desulfovibrio ferrophilus]|uniref:Uncharacterized protein n=1 Tax=Desulfovibrio ferrophilus TaxID=241368 RepID=A0A2Z6B1J6_9BACT|nr:uncharacterized protein DFE_2671 [Desulfovibrio ferrophilus]
MRPSTHISSGPSEADTCGSAPIANPRERVTSESREAGHLHKDLHRLPAQAAPAHFHKLPQYDLITPPITLAKH